MAVALLLLDAVRAKSLKLGSDMTLKLADNAVLKAFPNASQTYAILTIANGSDVWVTGGGRPIHTRPLPGKHVAVLHTASPEWQA